MQQLAIADLDLTAPTTEQWSADRRGWAVFSHDGAMRYRLARQLSYQLGAAELEIRGGIVSGRRRVVWLMLNPSTANAFVVDPTVQQCIQRALAWGADVTEVVNLFAYRSPKPADLLRFAPGLRGDDARNDQAILHACRGAYRVIAAWGRGGQLGQRAQHVCTLLELEGIQLHHLGLTQDGYPKHPLARGKHRIPKDQPLAAFVGIAA